MADPAIRSHRPDTEPPPYTPPRRVSAGERLNGMVRLMRPHQWIKNGFIPAPLFFTPAAVSAATVATVLLGTLCFCLVASAVYILNDRLDREVDRRHPTKCRRPLAAGTVTPGAAMVMMAVLAAGGLAGAALLSPAFMAVAAGYLLLNVGYSLGLKHRAIIDVLIIAIGFVLRVEAGALLAGVVPSVWIIVCTFLLALFLALAKRRDDLVKQLDATHRQALNGYSKPFLDSAFTATAGALLVSYAIYTTDTDVMARLGSERLYLTIPFVAAGILRYLQIIFVEERSGSPTRIVLTDGFMIGAVAGWIATFAILLYL
ncbi:decaprenyl-phosphate phosphoribosyltransferase [Azospirillum halopraeferens]|uniref:decaprenyl-phosphate phosphoribosyltransferase n=1 Tax=Azospirillum halopraeferens TaxID=34010 RepID=UPI0004127AFB|nr:decaprenyl-phosphate phosphoribosyltransferase [Azospirillum halopraeferens]